MADRGAWQLTGPVAVAAAEVPAPKKAKGDPPHRPPVVVPIATAEDREAVDRIRFGVARLDQPEADAVEDLRYHAIAPHAELTVVPGRIRQTMNRVLPTELAFHVRILRRWLARRFTGVSRKYLPNYLAQYAYTEDRGRNPDRMFQWLVRRVAQEPWRRDLALPAP
jgi:hypothetical protein